MGIDIAIVVAFLTLTLIIGTLKGKNITNIKEFAVGKKDFSTGAIVATLVATWISGSFLFVSIEKIYSEGITIILAYLAFPSIFLIMNYFFIPKMQEFFGNLSVADAMGKLYGPKAEFITAITGAISCLGMVAVQFKIFGTLFDYFFTFGSTQNLIISSLIVICYCAFGGIKSVTVTDIIQFLTFSLFLPVILFILLQNVEINHITEDITKTHFLDFHKLIDYKDPKFWSYITLLFYFTFPNFPPEIFQRILIAKDIKQIKTSFNLAFIACLIIVLLTISFVVLIYYSNPNLQPNMIFYYIIDNYLHVGVKGLAMIGIIAMIMSTADSNINSSAVLLTNIHNSISTLSDTKGLLFARVYTVMLGLGALCIALSSKDLLGTILITASFYMPIVNVPLMFAILGFRTSTKSVLIGMTAGFVTSTIFLFLDTKLDAIIPAMFVNMVFLFGSHYLLKQDGGWIKIKRDFDESSIEAQVDKKYIPFNVLQYIKSQMPINDKSYIIFGVVCFLTSISTIYSAHIYLETGHSAIALFLYVIMLICASFYIFYGLWPEGLKVSKFSILLWYFTLTYILSFSSIFFTLLSDFNKLPLIILTFNIVLLLMLTRWKTSIVLLTLGLFLSIFAYTFFIGMDSLVPILKQDNFMVLIALILIAISIITFLKPQQDEIEINKKTIDDLNMTITDLNDAVTHYSERVQDQLLEIERLGATAQKILNNVNHELRLPVGNVMNFAEMLSEGLEKYSKEQLKVLTDEVFKNSNRLSTMILNMLDLALLDVKKIDLNKKNINLSELVEDRVNNCRKIYLEQKPISFEMDVAPDTPVFVDPNYIRQTIDNLVINAINYSQGGTIKVSVQPKANNMVEIVIQDQGIGIPKSELYDIFTPFKMGTKTESKAEGRGVGLALCKSAVEAHGGSIVVESDGRCGATFRIILSMRK